MDCDSLAIGVRHEPGYALITAAGDTGVFTVARLRDHPLTLAGDGRPVLAGLDRALRLARTRAGALRARAGALRALPAAPGPAVQAPARPCPARR